MGYDITSNKETWFSWRAQEPHFFQIVCLEAETPLVHTCHKKDKKWEDILLEWHLLGRNKITDVESSAMELVGMKSYPRSFPCSAMQLIWCTTYNFYLLICLLSSSFIMFQFGNIQWKGYWKEINEVAIVMKTYWIHPKRHDSVEECRNHILPRLYAWKLRHISSYMELNGSEEWAIHFPYHKFECNSYFFF